MRVHGKKASLAPTLLHMDDQHVSHGPSRFRCRLREHLSHTTELRGLRLRAGGEIGLRGESAGAAGRRASSVFFNGIFSTRIVGATRLLHLIVQLLQGRRQPLEIVRRFVGPRPP